MYIKLAKVLTRFNYRPLTREIYVVEVYIFRIPRDKLFIRYLYRNGDCILIMLSRPRRHVGIVSPQVQKHLFSLINVIPNTNMKDT